MNRRRFLAVAAAATGGLAGCSSRGQRGTPQSTPPESTPPTVTDEPLARHGFPSSICSQDIVDLTIEAITEPAFAGDWESVDHPATFETGDLPDDAVVIGLEHDGRARAYPLAVVWRHEIVNDDFGVPLIVTYCPLCASGMVAERVVDGEPTVFGVSGQLWQPPGVQTRAAEHDGRVFGVNTTSGEKAEVKNQGNLVMYDAATGSFWSQMLARAICGVHRGSFLTVVPSTTARWGDWRREHPDTKILLPPPDSKAGNPPVEAPQDP